MMNRKAFSFFCLLVTVLALHACKEETAATITEEPIKDITGTWRVVSLTRNGEELAQRLDLSKFKINFKSDGTYVLQDKLAFPVTDGGTYKLNDAQYPAGLLLTQQGQQAKAIKFQFPVVAGKRQLSLTFSQGCAGNTYQYNFTREN